MSDKREPAMLGAYKVLLSSPAPSFGASAKSFWVQHKGAGATPESLFALVGDRASLFRINIADRYRGFSNPNMMHLLDWGVIDGSDDNQFLALIYKRPGGPSLHDAVIAHGTALADNDIIERILPPLAKAVKDLAEHQIAHGAIRPGNIHMTADGSVMLGECLSAPGAFDQPVSFLTIERGLASPIGRGAGTVADDIYALGATLVCLAVGGDLLARLDPRDAVMQKIERGSLNALLGRKRLGSALMELARGMLDDNPAQRWSIDVLQQWINGKHTMGAQILAGRETPRPLLVNGVELSDPRAIADALTRNVTEAMKLIANDELIKWVRRTLRDTTLAERIADAVNMPLLSNKPVSRDNRLVARVAMALHPAGPIRYHGYSLMPDAFGVVMSRALMAGESPQALAEIVTAQLPLYWYNIQPNFKEDHVGPIKAFDYARQMLDQIAIGGGIERCHYELSPTSLYLGEGFEKLTICDSKQFLLGLEIVAGGPKRPAHPITRQAAAFLAARDGQLGNRVLNRLARAKTEGEVAIGNLEILAAVHKHYDVGKLPNLCAWLETLAQPAIDRLHNRKSRETMRGELRKAAGSGSPQVMLWTIENAAFHQQDRDGLALAKRDYAVLDIEKSILLEELVPGSHIHRAVGREAATIVAGILSIVVVISLVALQIGQMH